MFLKFLLSCLLITVVYAEEVQLVPLVNKAINFKSKIYSYNVRLIKVNEKYKCKEYVNILDLKKNKYYASHYIGKDRILCLKDVYIPTINKIKFRFGNLEIEKEAELIRETDSYIRIKNIDGTIEKIYKDGRN